MRYPEYPATPVSLEETVLARWRAERLFEQAQEQSAGADEFVFYEGPPTANGKPGIHHVISRTIKDLVCRYHALRGKHVTRIAGWDTHGLPVEIEAEKKLGISGKNQIEALGVARFNDVCRDSVFTYKEDWERLSERIGYWLDYSRPYVTFASPYIESVWWIFSRLHEKGLIYRGYKSVPYCPRCGTALSSHEVAQGYQDIADPSLYFLAPLVNEDGSADADGRAFVVWTTTPWTLPSNTALAVHPDLEYVEVEKDGQRLILAESRREAVVGADAPVLKRWRGRELDGQRYERPFTLVRAEARGRAWQVLLEEFVSADDGTGIVHMAPAFGADDYAAGLRYDLPLLRPVDDAGRFDASLPLIGGMFVKDADPLLVEELRKQRLLYRHTLETHSYPHCWRCSSPLIYMARDSWYIRTTAIRDVMIENNRQVQWHPPEVGTGRFGEWLEGNIDWAISRERYWGTPLPFWVCDADPEHFEVLGSFAALAERAGPLPEPFDPHKPHIDTLTYACPHCSGTMRRTPEVADVWFDSGSMPYAQWHYPFENEPQWQRHFPADFICEGLDQTRGWFYSLIAISSMLGDGPSYRNVVVNGLVLDAEGQKMSKSRGNVVDPWEAIERFGADAIRWYFIAVSQPWATRRFDPDALADTWRRVSDTIANTYRFFALYANLEDWTPDQSARSDDVLDRWMHARLATLTAQVRDDLDAYELTHAARAIADFVVDDLSNWYVRRTRDRFWGSGDTEDTRAAFTTLHTALTTIAGLMAPFTPFHADWLHVALTGTSVHLTRFPEVDESARDDRLEQGMTAVRELSRLGRAARETVRIRVRQPLRTLHAVVPDGVSVDDALLDVVKDELNIKEVRFLRGAEDLVTLRAQPNFRVLGKRFGGSTQAAAQAVRALGNDVLRAFRAGGPLSIELDGARYELSADEVEIIEEAQGALAVETDGGYTIALDPALDAELQREGLARELVSRIQRLRKDSGLAVSDRIRLRIDGGTEVHEATNAFTDYISNETLAVELTVGGSEALWDVVHDTDIDGIPAHIALARA